MITEARAHGDLSENAEYHAAKERQAFIEGRVMDLEDKLSRADVIDVSKLSGKTVKFGATVTLADEDTDAKVKYQIVGDLEADAKKGRISISSPIARALIGKSAGRHGRGVGTRRRAVLRDPEGAVRLNAGVDGRDRARNALKRRQLHPLRCAFYLQSDRNRDLLVHGKAAEADAARCRRLLLPILLRPDGTVRGKGRCGCALSAAGLY